MSRYPAVADRFYPGDSKTLKHTLQKYVPGKTKKTREALGAVSPHAGYIYSGSVCGETLSTISIPETVVILGPNHHGVGAPVSLSLETWKMPMGDVAVNQELTEILLKTTLVIEVDESAHKLEHSLEVQIPFLQYLQKNLSIVPLVVSHLPYSVCREVAKSLAYAIDKFDKPVLMLASSDMSHYISREKATMKDQLALKNLTAMDPEGLYTTVHSNQISMCGIIPVTIVLQAAMLLGATTAEIIRYTDSGEVSGDIDQVVGYAGAVIS